MSLRRVDTERVGEGGRAAREGAGRDSEKGPQHLMRLRRGSMSVGAADQAD